MRSLRRAVVGLIVLALLAAGALLVRAVVNFWVLWLLLMFVALAQGR